LLASTGVLGKPAEYFCAEAMRDSIPGYPADPEEQLSCISSVGATPNGIYGVKLHCVEFDQVQATRWAERLPDLSFVFLERRDVLAQAISYVRACQTDQWRSTGQARAEPSYDPAAINRALIGTLSNLNRWRYYLMRNGISYLHLFYEDVVDAPQGTVEAVGRLVGLDETPRIDASRLRLKMQRDALSEDWRKRFVAEMRDLSQFH
jgi:LPS sulfotransferase NodH